MSGISVCSSCVIVADPWNSCVGDFCEYFCGKVAISGIPVSGITVCNTVA